MWMGIISVASAIPGGSAPNWCARYQLDKLAHLGEFAVLGALLRFAFGRDSGWTRPLLIGAAFSALDELHQRFVPGRECDLRDWVADIVGIIIGLVLMRPIVKHPATDLRRVS